MPRNNLLAILCLAPLATAAAPLAPIEICLVNAKDPMFLKPATRLAGRVLRDARVEPAWHDAKDCPAGAIYLAFNEHTPPDHRPGAMAVAVVPARRITVFLDRVRRSGGAEAEIPLLGHVLAHEIVHVLQGTARHSSSGLMSARYSALEIRRMMTNLLPLQKIDVELIHAHLAPSHGDANADILE